VWDLGFFAFMKHQVVAFLCLSLSGLVFAQNSTFNISQAGTMVEDREVALKRRL
jgi:hypothetical protein